MSSLSLRCTLTGFERIYQVNNPTPLLYNHLSTLINDSSWKWWFTGFSDAESTFYISIRRDNTYKLKWKISLSFAIKLHIRDIGILYFIKKQLGIGIINTSGTFCHYQFRDMQGLGMIIEHFHNYPLISLKSVDFLIFKNVFELIKRGEHLHLMGIQNIVALKANQNRGLSNLLKIAFPNV